MISKLILCNNIKLDKSYTNVLNYTVEQMLELVNANKTAETTKASFINYVDNKINVDFGYDVCVNSNYLAFQNPLYSNKWFFAFIDDVEFRSEKNSIITFTVDVWTTWHNQINFKPCFVEREHVNDDTAGLHTIPESLEMGDPINVGTFDSTTELGGNYIIVANTQIYETKVSGSIYGGVFSGVQYLAFQQSNYQEVIDYINAMTEAGHKDAIIDIFMCPFFVIDSLLQDDKLVKPSTFPRQTETGITKNLILDGYVPKNKKLLTFPYNYLNVTNNAGSTNVYKYEDFKTTKEGFEDGCLFNIFGVLTPGCSIKLVPEEYKGKTKNFDEALTGAKYPTCSWTSDSYTNWLTQQAVNVGIAGVNAGVKMAGSVGGLIAGDISNVGGLYSGAMDIARLMEQKYEMALIPPSSHGNVNSGDVIFALNKNCFTFNRMSIKREYAEIIDNYFSRFGYKVNITKIPNITGRLNFNYVQIGSSESLGTGNIPSKYLESINSTARRGFTIWHNHANLGNYNVNNPII